MRISSFHFTSLRKIARRQFIPVGLLLVLLLATLVAGCGGDDPVAVESESMADVNAYVAGLNSWPTPSADNDDANGTPTDGTDTVGGTDYACTTTPYSITQTPEKIVVFDPDDEIFWLGALLQGNGFRGGIGSLSELPVRQRGSMEISIDILGTGATRTVANPSPTTVNAAIGELITLAQNSGQTFASDILFNQTETYSVAQSAIKMGLSANYLGASASASLDYSQSAVENTVSAYFLQKMFTTSMTLPQLPGDVFSSAFTEERLQEQVNLGRIATGKWQFKIDSLDQGIKEKWYDQKFTETVTLPGSMVENDKGNPVGYNTKWLGALRNKNWFEEENYKPYLSEDEFLFPYWLIPDKHYYGAAWYQKTITIPNSWKGKNIELYLERAHWETRVWVDGQKIGMNNSLGTAHRYDLSNSLTPGEHRISICVDNRMKDVDVGQDSHSVSDHTQSNWNGIIGELKLVKKDEISIANVRVYPNIAQKNIQIEIDYLNISGEDQLANLKLQVIGQNEASSKIGSIEKDIKIGKKSGTVSVIYPMGDQLLLWDEFDPNLYELKIQVNSKFTEDIKEVRFGMREFKTKGTQFTINERPVFLRGTLESAIFPKTGYPPTDVDAWKRIINICKDHGLNHIRFHSWCPPEAAFVAADELGFYYQVEVSSWANSTSSIGDGKPIDKWLYQESERMVRDYGNHASFCLMAYGNEPAGKNQKKYLAEFVNFWKNKDNRRVYTGGAGWPFIPENQFHNDPKPRIQGWDEQLKSIINSEPPRTNYDWSDRLDKNDRPVVSHEIGQWCVYPNLKEIEKYDGILKAKNFEIFKRSLNAHKMEELADSLLLASGKLQALCYKADIEAALRTPGFGGFQLLDLHDFPGQGSALVGVLDAFWEEKGYISPEEYRRFCNETVPLARFSKFIFKSGENIDVGIEVAHFGANELENITPEWKIVDSDKKIIQQGALETTEIKWGNGIKLGNINTSIDTEYAIKLTLEVETAGFSNSWDFWVYPINQPKLDEEILVVQKLNQKSLKTLEKGGKVLLTIKKGAVKDDQGGNVGIGFSSIFWNTAWTGGQKPHTLGILCNPDHKAFEEFPTEYHSNWQWWDAMTHSNAISLENLPDDIIPITRVIDDWVSNRRLALIFEVKVGKGKLLISGIDLLDNANNRLEAKQLLYSLKKYMAGGSFDPSIEVGLASIENLFK